MGKEVSKEKVIKLLQLSTTDSDHESLNAIRRANEILIKADLHWDEFIGGVSTTSNRRNIPDKENKRLKRENEMLERNNERLEEDILRLTNALKRKENVVTKLFGDIRTLKRKVEDYNDASDIRSPYINMSPDMSPFDTSERVDFPQVRAKIEICLKAMPYHAFLHSLDDFWKQNGFLTPNQMKSLDTIYNNL